MRSLIILSGIFLLLTESACAQPTLTWKTETCCGMPLNGNDNLGSKSSLAVNKDFVFANGKASGYPSDWQTVRYDAATGSDLKKNHPAKGGNAEANGIAAGKDGVLYAVGINYPLGGCGIGGNDPCWPSIQVVKYTSYLDTLWVRDYYSNSGDFGSAVALDRSDSTSVYAAGFGDTLFRLIVVKFDENGNMLWKKSLILAQSAHPHFVKSLYSDVDGNLYVSGYANCYYSDCEWILAKLDKNGNTLWTVTDDVSSGGNDRSYGMAVDNNGDVFLAGSIHNGTNNDFCVKKYDGNTGQSLWTSVYDNGGQDAARDIAWDGKEAVYATGFSNGNGTGADYFTVRYNSLTGDTVWTRRYHGLGGGPDKTWALDLGSGYVYVTGESGNGSDQDFLTIKYDASGNVLWTERYDGGYGDDIGRNIVADKERDCIYVTGSDKGSGGDTNFVTIKYCDDLITDVKPLTEDEEGEFVIYPNPAAETLRYRIYSERSSSFLLEFTDMLGRSVKTFSSDLKQGFNHSTVEINDLPVGMYVVRILYGTKVIVKKIIIKQVR